MHSIIFVSLKHEGNVPVSDYKNKSIFLFVWLCLISFLLFLEINCMHEKRSHVSGSLSYYQRYVWNDRKEHFSGWGKNTRKRQNVHCPTHGWIFSKTFIKMWLRGIMKRSCPTEEISFTSLFLFNIAISWGPLNVS